MPRRARLTRSTAASLLLLAAAACNVYEAGLVSEATQLGGSGGGGSMGSEAGTESGATSGVSGSSAAGTNGGIAGQSPGTAGSSGGGTDNTPDAGSGGVGGAGGQPGAGDGDAVDDMEDDDAQIGVTAGRNGRWYVGNDGTAGGTQEPMVGAFRMSALTAGERDGSSFAARMQVEGFTSWGSVIGFNFVEQLGTVEGYDASAYCGVRYWAKAAAPTTLRFRVSDGNTHPAGGVCVDGGGPGEACYDHFNKSAMFGTSWQQISASFAELLQTGSGYHPADKQLKTDELYGLEWSLPGDGRAYEIWIDDVELIYCE